MVFFLSSPLDLFRSTPIGTKGFTAATLVFSLVYAFTRFSGYTDGSSPPWLLLVPGSSLFFPWTFISAVLVETSIIQLAFTLLFVPASLRYFERIWSTAELLKFVVVTTTIPNFMAFALRWLQYVFTSDVYYLYGTTIHGQGALQMAILVAMTQAIPEHQVQLFGVLQMRVKQLPMIYLGISLLLTIFGFSDFLINLFGWIAGYLYLRFFKKNTSDSTGGSVYSYGDRSETFSFVAWFPPVMHAPISKVSNLAHGIASRLKLIPTSSLDIEQGSNGGYVPVPGGARAEAERRRAMALKALDQRLAHTATPPPATSGPARPSPPVAAASSKSSSGSSGKPKVETEEGDVGSTGSR